jgi:SARP family transcriptional regulator, regulator of embCAB operon
VDIDVLGPLTARIAGVSITPSAAKPRKVLAMLAVHADEVVPVASLYEELWGEAVPRSAGTTLQTYVFHLRGLIGAAMKQAQVDGDPKAVLLTQPGGYLLRGGVVDVKEFDRRALEGHRAREKGDFRAAARLFREALAYFRGEALVDVQAGPMLEVELDRLNEARLNVLDRRIDCDLRLGRHHELVGELTALVARNRMHEGLTAHLMVALYRCGRRGHAVEVYRRLRQNLVNELGLEPSPALHRLQRLILTADARLALPAEAEAQLEHVG